MSINQLGLLMAVLLITDWFVDKNNANCGATGNGTQGAPFCDIGDAVQAAASGDTIRIAPGTYVENLTLDKKLTLIGTAGRAVTIVDGNDAGSVVSVQGSPGPTLMVTLQGLTLRNGTAAKGGGIHVSSYASATLSNATVSGNVATQAGGGAYVAYYGGISFTNCEVSGNSTTGNGGGVYAGGDVFLTNSTVNNNLGVSGGGASATRTAKRI